MKTAKKTKYAEYALSRRERQIMNVVFRLGRATVNDVVDNIPDPPTTGSARALLNILLKKGLVTSTEEGPRKVYSPVVNQKKAATSALGQVVDTFFGGSSSELVAALLDVKKDSLTEAELQRIAALIEKRREEEDFSD